MQETEAQLSRRLDTIAQELRRIFCDQPQNKSVEDTGSSGTGKVKDSEIGGTMDDDMILKLFPTLVSIIFVLTIYKLEWVPRRGWKI